MNNLICAGVGAIKNIFKILNLYVICLCVFIGRGAFDALDDKLFVCKCKSARTDFNVGRIKYHSFKV